MNENSAEITDHTVPAQVRVEWAATRYQSWRSDRLPPDSISSSQSNAPSSSQIWTLSASSENVAADSPDTTATISTSPITSTNDSDNAPPRPLERHPNVQSHSKERHGALAWDNAWVIGLPTLILTAIYGWFSIRLQQEQIRLQQEANDIAIKQLNQSVSLFLSFGGQMHSTQTEREIFRSVIGKRYPWSSLDLGSKDSFGEDGRWDRSCIRQCRKSFAAIRDCSAHPKPDRG